MFTKAFTPEQSAQGTLENGLDVTILYIKEFDKEALKINELEEKSFTYNWFHNPKENSYVLQAIWQEDLHLAVKFEQQHFSLLAKMIEPTTLVISTLPISQLVIERKDSDKAVLEFPKEVVSLTNIVFEDPTSFYH